MLSIALGLVGCWRGSTSSADYTIEPKATALHPGETAQFSVTDEKSVLWGVAESRQRRLAQPPAYPLKVSANRRYLVDQQNRPWRVQADAAWLMSGAATPAEVDQYLEKRQQQGFNSFYLSAIVHPGGYESVPNAPNNLAGDPPFATPGDFSTAGSSPKSERYWAWIDSIIDKAAARDIVVMLSYTYLGNGGGNQGWYREVMAQPNQRALFDWGRWLGKRYKHKSNIIWFGLGDFAPEAASEGAQRSVAIAQGIKASGATQLFMAEAAPPDTLPGEDPDFGSIVDMNSFYGYGPDGVGTVYETGDRAWKSSPTKPAWMEEGTYEYESNYPHFSRKPWDTRRGRFWSVLAGGTAGDGFGSREAWQWEDLPDSLSTPGADYSSYAFQLFSTLPWWELRPSGTDPGYAGIHLILKGGGQWGELDYVASALTTDRKWLLAYAPVLEKGTRTFSVDMAAMAGRVRARWFDPATGNYLAISDSYEYKNSGQRDFTTPGSRDDGTDDWLLVLDADGSPPCGSISTTGMYTAPASIPNGISCDVTATLRASPSVMARAPLRFSR